MNNKIKYLSPFLLLALILTACNTPASTPVDAATIAQGFWDAMIAQNVDAAMAYLADDVQIIGGPASSYTKDSFSALISAASVTFEISDLKAISEDTVTYSGKVYENGNLLASGDARKIQIKDGKIILIEVP